jgi:hypothetical protein
MTGTFNEHRCQNWVARRAHVELLSCVAIGRCLRGLSARTALLRAELIPCSRPDTGLDTCTGLKKNHPTLVSTVEYVR